MQQHMQAFGRLAENLVGVSGPFFLRRQWSRAERSGDDGDGQKFHGLCF